MRHAFNVVSFSKIQFSTAEVRLVAFAVAESGCHLQNETTVSGDDHEVFLHNRFHHWVDTSDPLSDSQNPQRSRTAEVDTSHTRMIMINSCFSRPTQRHHVQKYGLSDIPMVLMTVRLIAGDRRSDEVQLEAQAEVRRRLCLAFRHSYGGVCGFVTQST